jgi:hypothetical protein
MAGFKKNLATTNLSLSAIFVIFSLQVSLVVLKKNNSNPVNNLTIFVDYF